MPVPQHLFERFMQNIRGVRGRLSTANPFGDPRIAAVWSRISWVMPMPPPIWLEGIWPAMHSTGAFDPDAVAMAAPVLSSPGPGPTIQAPTRPLACA